MNTTTEFFELTDEMVWSKAVKDTAGLIAYHEANTSKFMWGERIEMSAYTCENAEIAEQGGNRSWRRRS